MTKLHRGVKVIDAGIAVNSQPWKEVEESEKCGKEDNGKGLFIGGGQLISVYP